MYAEEKAALPKNARKYFLEYGAEVRNVKTTVPTNTEEGKYIGLMAFNLYQILPYVLMMVAN
mgnify:CR=1 FL=1